MPVMNHSPTRTVALLSALGAGFLAGRLSAPGSSGTANANGNDSLEAVIAEFLLNGVGAVAPRKEIG